MLVRIAFVLAFILQALLAVALEHKRIKAPVKKLMPTVFLFPVFMIIYAAAITIGVFKKPKWKQIKRNVVSSGTDTPPDVRSSPPTEEVSNE